VFAPYCYITLIPFLNLFYYRIKNYRIIFAYLPAFAASYTFAVIYPAGIHLAGLYAVFALRAFCLVYINSRHRAAVKKRIYSAERADKTAKKSVYKN